MTQDKPDPYIVYDIVHNDFIEKMEVLQLIKLLIEYWAGFGCEYIFYDFNDRKWDRFTYDRDTQTVNVNPLEGAYNNGQFKIWLLLVAGALLFMNKRYNFHS